MEGKTTKIEKRTKKRVAQQIQKKLIRVTHMMLLGVQRML